MGKDIKVTMRGHQLTSALQAAAIYNDYDANPKYSFTKALKDTEGFIDECSTDWQSGINSRSDAIEAYASIVMSTSADMSEDKRNVFMVSLHNTPLNKLSESVAYKYIQQDNPSDYDSRVISLIGRSKDAKGNTIYDYLDKYCSNHKEDQLCQVMLLRMKDAMDKDEANGHPIPSEIKLKFDECAKKAGLKPYETYREAEKIEGRKLAEKTQKRGNNRNPSLTDIQKYGVPGRNYE